VKADAADESLLYLSVFTLGEMPQVLPWIQTPVEIPVPAKPGPNRARRAHARRLTRERTDRIM